MRARLFKCSARPRLNRASNEAGSHARILYQQCIVCIYIYLLLNTAEGKKIIRGYYTITMWPKPFMKLYLSFVYETLISQELQLCPKTEILKLYHQILVL